MSDEYLNFYLYRITVHPSGQLDLFGRLADLDRRDLLRMAIESEPASSPTEEYRWFLSKASAVEHDGYYQRLGRAAKVVITEMDSAGRFYDREDTTVLNTHVFIDVHFQVCAIGYKSQITSSVRALGNSLAAAFNHTDVAKLYGAEFEVAPLKEPGSFLNKLRSAYRVTNLSVTTRRPNPWDAPKFYRSVAESLEDMGGREAEIKWKGEMVPGPTMETAVSEAAATGRDAQATIKDGPKSKPVRHTMSDEHISLGQRIDNAIENGRTILSIARMVYQNVKSGGASLKQVKAAAEQEHVIVKVGRGNDEG